MVEQEDRTPSRFCRDALAALETADIGYVLETGEIIQSGQANQLTHDPRLIAAYLEGH